MRGDLDRHRAFRRLRLGGSNKLEAAGGRDLPRDDFCSSGMPRLDEQRQAQRFAYWWPAFGESRKIRSPRRTNACKRRIDHRLIAAIDPDTRIKRGDLRQHVQEKRAVDIGLARRAIGEHCLEGNDAGVPQRCQRIVIARMNRGLERKVDIRTSLAGFARKVESGNRIDRRARIRHAHHRGDAADGRRRASARKILLLRLAGVAHVDVSIDEARKQQPLARVDHDVGRRSIGAGKARGDTAVSRDDAARRDALGGHDPRVVNAKRRHCRCTKAGSGRRRSRPAFRCCRRWRGPRSAAPSRYPESGRRSTCRR